MQLRKSIFILSLFALLLPALAGAYPAEVSRTGQTTCYDTAGIVIDCGDKGQDGDWLAGVPWPDTRFNERADGTVSDNLTGLVWAQNANLMVARNPGFDNDNISDDGRVTWQHALDYVAKLNNENYLSHSDWRLPNVNELESLVNAELYTPALPNLHPFINVESHLYWSSTTNASFSDFAWGVYFDDGGVYHDAKTDWCYVWPVCSGQCGSSGNSVICLPKTGQTSCYSTAGDKITCAGTGQDGDLLKGVVRPDPRFTEHGDNTTTDNLTGLMWAKDANLPIGVLTWQGALEYVADMNAGTHANFGYTDWRLPNRRELRSLADYELFTPALPLGHPFTQVQSSGYWSSTSYAYGTGDAWLVHFYYGAVIPDNKTYNGHYVWPVRSGQVGNSVITTTTTSVGSTTTVPATTTTAITTTSIISSTTTTTTTGICPAKKALGENNPNLENLRDFRDSKLAQSAVGRKVIQIYYNNADRINAALERSPALRAVARRVLEVIAPMVGKN